MSLIQKLAVAYALLFFAVVAIGYIPAFNDADGNLFGLFSLQWYDDLLHAFSGVWALAAAFISHRQAVFYFKLFGSVYLFDGVLGLITGSGCLDAGIFINGFRSFDDIEFPTRFFANAPHLAIGGFAVFVGFWLSKRVSEKLALA
jgi:Domain of unknown function (DUF4383)